MFQIDFYTYEVNLCYLSFYNLQKNGPRAKWTISTYQINIRNVCLSVTLDPLTTREKNRQISS